MKGVLYVVALPIGNLKDITLRALETLREVDLILTEDTRSFLKLQRAYELPPKRLESFYKDVERRKEEKIIELLREGKRVALCSEAGTPLLSDPGCSLVKRALEEGVTVVPIPGASAITCALSVSGFNLSQGFVFLGFPPRNKGEFQEKLAKIPPELPLVLFLSPHRFHQEIKILLECLGNREVLLARELTKFHEEIRRSTLEELSQIENIKGEITLVIGQAEERRESPLNFEVDLRREYELLREKGLRKREIAKEIAQKKGLSVKEVYELIKDY